MTVNRSAASDTLLWYIRWYLCRTISCYGELKHRDYYIPHYNSVITPTWCTKRRFNTSTTAAVIRQAHNHNHQNSLLCSAGIIWVLWYLGEDLKMLYYYTYYLINPLIINSLDYKEQIVNTTKEVRVHSPWM